MSTNYFDFFPKINYSLFRDDSYLLVTDLTQRFNLRSKILNDPRNFYNYIIFEEERPDMVAHKEYDDPKLDWMILISNKIFDPIWEWPMGYYDFEEYIKGKYGSLEYSQTHIQRYEKIIQEEEWLVDGTHIQERVIIIDSTQYQSTPVSNRRAVYYYDYEKELMEKRRFIKLLHKNFIPEVLEEAKSILL